MWEEWQQTEILPSERGERGLVARIIVKAKNLTMP
jgi:hypothetical protein